MTTAMLLPSSAPEAAAAAPGNDVVVSVRHLTKRFKQYPTPASRLVEWASLGMLRRHALFTALDDISFTVKKGEFFGIIGANGSGKSTLLKVLTGILVPSSGSYSVRGRITSLLELGTGFNPELSGRDNLINSGRLLGFEPGVVRGKLEQIVAFAELEESIDVPIKYYSTGMTVRLAFALFSHVEPDVFIVDEALSVGDVAFSRKCFARLDVMRESGCTLLFVSHDLAAVRKYCDQVMFLSHGRCAFLGSATATTDMYLEAMSPGALARKLAPEAPGALLRARKADDIRHEAQRLRGQLSGRLAEIFDEASFHGPLGEVAGRIGTGEVRIAAVAVLDEQGARRDQFFVGETARFHVLGRASADVAQGTVSAQLVNRLGVVAWGTNHARLSGQTLRIEAGSWIHATFEVRLDLGPDHYTLDVGFGDASGQGHVFDRITAAATIALEIRGHVDFEGLARLPAKGEVEMTR